MYSVARSVVLSVYVHLCTFLLSSIYCVLSITVKLHSFTSVLFPRQYVLCRVLSSGNVLQLLQTPAHEQGNDLNRHQQIVTGCSLIIVFFLKIVIVIFLNSASSAAALVFYLPGVCTHTDTEGEHQRKARVRNILKSLEKNTIFSEHPVVVG